MTCIKATAPCQASIFQGKSLPEKETSLATPTQHQTAGVSLRRTKAEDMESVVALDAAVVGHPRRLYFERRRKAALAQTERHVQFSAERGGRFAGFQPARVLVSASTLGVFRERQHEQRRQQEYCRHRGRLL